MQHVATNRNHQTFVRIAGQHEGRATRKQTAKTTTLKLSAAATRAIVILAPAAERDDLAARAIEMANADDRAIRAMVWDVHVFAALDPDAQIRPGVVADDYARSVRRAHGLKAASVESPRAQ